MLIFILCTLMVALTNYLMSPWVRNNEYNFNTEAMTTKINAFVGSGSLAAMATFEDRYRPNMEVSRTDVIITTYLFVFVLQRDEAMQLVRDAIAAGIFNDLVCSCKQHGTQQCPHLSLSRDQEVMWICVS